MCTNVCTRLSVAPKWYVALVLVACRECLFREQPNFTYQLITGYEADGSAMAPPANHVPMKVGIKLNLFNPDCGVVAFRNYCPDDLIRTLQRLPRNEIIIGLGKPGFPKTLAIPSAIS